MCVLFFLDDFFGKPNILIFRHIFAQQYLFFFTIIYNSFCVMFRYVEYSSVPGAAEKSIRDVDNYNPFQEVSHRHKSCGNVSS